MYKWQKILRKEKLLQITLSSKDIVKKLTIHLLKMVRLIENEIWHGQIKFRYEKEIEIRGRYLFLSCDIEYCLLNEFCLKQRPLYFLDETERVILILKTNRLLIHPLVAFS